MTPAELADRAYRVVEAERRGIRLVPDNPGKEFPVVPFGCIRYPFCKSRCTMKACLVE